MILVMMNGLWVTREKYLDPNQAGPLVVTPKDHSAVPWFPPMQSTGGDDHGRALHGVNRSRTGGIHLFREQVHHLVGRILAKM